MSGRSIRGVSLSELTLVDSPGLAESAGIILMAADVVGFDTESKPIFRKGEISDGPHLVQLAVEQQVYLFPVWCAATHGLLKRVLESPAIIKAGFGLGNDRSALRVRLGIELNNTVDLGEKLRGPGHRGTVGAKVAVAHFFWRKADQVKEVGDQQLGQQALGRAPDVICSQ